MARKKKRVVKKVKIAKHNVRHKIEKLKKARQHVEGKHIPLKVAGALLMILGLISILSGLLMAFLAQSVSGEIIAFAQTLMASHSAIFVLGITSVSLGIFEFLIGNGIWKRRKWAGLIAVTVLVFSIIANIPYLYLNLFSGSLGLILSALILILLYIGWKELEGGF